MEVMSNDTINNKINELIGRFKDLPLDVQISKSIDYLNEQLREHPFVALYHEMKKELTKKQNLL